MRVAITSVTAPCVDPKECEIGANFEVFGNEPRLGEGTYHVGEVKKNFQLLSTNL